MVNNIIHENFSAKGRYYLYIFLFMEQIAIALSSVIVSVITSGTKRLKKIELSPNRKEVIRVIVAVLSIISAVLTAWYTGNVLETTAIETALNSILVFLGSQGWYLLGKK